MFALRHRSLRVAIHFRWTLPIGRQECSSWTLARAHRRSAVEHKRILFEGPHLCKLAGVCSAIHARVLASRVRICDSACDGAAADVVVADAADVDRIRSDELHLSYGNGSSGGCGSYLAANDFASVDLSRKRVLVSRANR